MPIVLGAYTFPDRAVTVADERGDVAGRDTRTLRITGILDNLPSVDALEAALDEIMRAAAAEGDDTLLSVRPGRALRVRRTAALREIHHAARTALFRLDFEATDPIELALDPTVLSAQVSAAAPTLLVPTLGNCEAPAVVALAPTVPVYTPGVTDGLRTITYGGAVQPGQTLVFDGESGKAFLDGADVTREIAGDFPRVAPPESTLEFTRAFFSDLAGTATVSLHDRWW